MAKRRTFLSKLTRSTLSVPFISLSCFGENQNTHNPPFGKSLVISTWDTPEATQNAWKVLANNGNSLDAVESGVKTEESNQENQSVGYGGLPDRDGRVTLDACIMDWKGNAGSVSFLEDIKHPISVARRVMEKTPHVMLVGAGAQQFALEEGFKKTDLLTENSKAAYQEWKKESKYKPIINIENHDTIGMLAMDSKGNISGACTTSGLAYKMRGRVGDSPIIGAGLFVDNEIGGAVATGLGEAVLRTLASFLVVEFMRQGDSPKGACEKAIKRIISKHSNYKDFQVAIIAVNKKGETGAFSIHPEFIYVKNQGGKNQIIDAKSFL